MIKNLKMIADAATNLQRIVHMVVATENMILAFDNEDHQYNSELEAMKRMHQTMQQRYRDGEDLFKRTVVGNDNAVDVFAEMCECEKLYRQVIWYADMPRRDHEKLMEQISGELGNMPF